MKESITVGLALTALLFALTWLHAGESAPAEEEAPPAPAVTAAAPAAAGEEAVAVGLRDEEISLRVLIGDAVETMTMAEYLPCVVQGEMLPAFEEAALSAQAVAERTYILYQIQSGGKPRHPQADVCDDPGCCSAYLSQAEAKEKWGDQYEALAQRVKDAVAATDGVVALYDGQPIMAVFHSSSGGATARCADVWAADLPYLVSVESPEGADTVPNYYSVKTVPEADFQATFAAAHPEADFSGDWLGSPVADVSGRVASLTVGGVTVSGAEMRRLYGLRSTAFTVVREGEGVTFRVTGYGHGVGMSQYGANELARQGKTWQEILQWYYTGVTLGGYTNS
ncbi:MAG: stage II sporulation protein D [Oscillospiraceae bacterium]|nr:stage II sporulation protein D [Oscillospiraceae bacterium]